jgi:hypothetical protein
MNIKNNPPRRTALIWTGITILGIFLIFLPWIIGMDGFNGGFALSFGGGFLAIMGIIAAIIYARMSEILDRIIKPENVLAHWTYSPEEWKAYTEQEHKEDAEAKKGLFILISVISIVVGIIFFAIVRDNFVVILCIILGIIAIVGITALLSTFSNYQHNKNSLGETFIALDGVYLNRQLHIWKGIGNQLEEAVYELDDKSNPRLRFEYSSPSRNGRNYYTARVPVPPGMETNARWVIDQVLAVHMPGSRI